MSMRSWARNGLGSGRRGRENESVDVDLTSAIDVVFQLLIFFAVTSTMTGQKDVAVPPARHGKGVNPKESIVITLREPRQIGADSVLVLGDGEGAEADIDQVRQMIEQGIASGKTQVLIKAEKKVPHGDVLRVARIVGSLAGSLFIGVQQIP